MLFSEQRYAFNTILFIILLVYAFQMIPTYLESQLLLILKDVPVIIVHQPGNA